MVRKIFHPEDHLYSISDIMKYLENEMDEECASKFKKHLLECEICEKTAYRLAKMAAFHEATKSLREGHLQSNDINDYLANSISEAKKRKIENHIRECKYCKRAVEIIKLRTEYISKTKRKIYSVYEDHFNYVSRIFPVEFKHLKNGLWIELNAIDIRQLKLEEKDRKKINAFETIQNCINSGQNVLITGESGGGKTFTCLKLFEHIKKKYIYSKTKSKEKIPIFINLSKIKNNNLCSLILKTIDKDIFKRDKDRYVIFLDGLNKIGNIAKQERTLIQINEFANINPSTRIFVTTQTLGGLHVSLETFTVYEIQPLKQDKVIEYLEKFEDKFGTKKEAKIFYDNLTEPVKNFISIPVFLYILVLTYNKDKIIKISRLGELFREYVEFLCGTRSLSRPGLKKVYRENVVSFLSFNMYKENKNKITLEEFNEYIKNYNYEFHSSIDEREVKEILTYMFNVLSEDENGRLKFTRQVLKDYFTAIYMKNLKMKPDDIFNLVYIDSIRNDNFVNAVKFLVGIIEPEKAKDIIQKFIEKDIYLGCILFNCSSISILKEKFIKLMDNRIKIDSREYFLNLDKVLSFYLKVLDILQKANKLDKPISSFYMQELGIIYYDKLEYDKAIEIYSNAITIYQNNYMQTHIEYAKCHINLGNAYSEKLEYDKAIKNYYNKAISIYEQNNMHTHPAYALCHMNLGNAYNKKLDYDSAIECYKKAISIYEQNNMHTHPAYALCHMNLGTAYNKKLDYDSAIKCYKRAISIHEQNNMYTHPDYALCHMNLGTAHNAKLEYESAIECYKKAISIYEQNNMHTHPAYALCHMNLGTAYSGMCKKDEAMQPLELALSIFEQSVGMNHPDYKL